MYTLCVYTYSTYICTATRFQSITQGGRQFNSSKYLCNYKSLQSLDNVRIDNTYRSHYYLYNHILLWNKSVM